MEKTSRMGIGIIIIGIVLAIAVAAGMYAYIGRKSAPALSPSSDAGQTATSAARQFNAGTAESDSGSGSTQAFAAPAASASSTLASGSLLIGNAKVSVEIAATEAEREKGLSGRESLGANEGLFFVEDTPSYIGIWMKDMKFPIDVVWFDADMKIVDIVEKMQPNSYPMVYLPKAPAQYVVELQSGFAAAHDIKIGDQAKIAAGR